MKNFKHEDLIRFEALNMLCGKLLGNGVHRTVFENAFDSSLVVKISNSPNGIRANYAEYEIWQEIQSSKYKRYFAKVKEMSGYGSILIADYVPDLPIGKYKIPSFFADLKRENFGLVGTQVVCRDYAYNRIVEHIDKPIKLIEVEFR